MNELNKRELYRMPWSMNDNPIGWLETTDICNVACLGCYRQKIVGHRSLDLLKEDILFLKRWRNVYNISIAGGEPLLHPDILEIVSFIRQNGMEPLVLSNGRAMTPELLRDLKKAGMLGLSFHVDSLQKREPEWTGKTEAELNDLRDELLEMASSIDMYCNFGMTVYRSNFEQINDVVRWAHKRIDKVHGLVMITFRAAGVGGDVDYYTPSGDRIAPAELGYAFDDQEILEDAGLTSADVRNKIRSEFPHYEASAYLGGTQRHDSIKWLLNAQVGLKDGQMIGSIGPRLMEAVQVWQHWFKGTYLTYLPCNQVGKKLFLTALFDKQTRQTWRAYLKAVASKPSLLFSPIYTQTIGIIQAPDVLPDGRTDMCDSCPDMCVHEGTLVHSCRWDEWRLYDGYLRPQQHEVDVDLDEEEPEKVLEQS